MGTMRCIARRSMKAASAGLVLLAALAPATGRAETDVGGRVGAYAEEGSGFVGGEVLSNLGRSEAWYINPNLEYVFEDDDSDLVTVNVDFHYDIATQGRFAVWFGGGPALLYLDEDGGGSDSDVGVNLLAGFGAKRGNARPYVQGKVIVADDSQAVLGIGVRF